MRVIRPPRADFLPPSAPSRQDLTAGTTSVNVDFGRATGQTTSGTPTAFIDKPSGSSASVSVSDTGSAWRIAISGMADGEAYRVGLAFTASDGQVCFQTAEVTVAPGTSGWEVLADWDFTTGTPQSGLGTAGTYTLALTAGNVSLTTIVVAGVNVPSCTASLGASGLDISVSRASGTGGASMVFAFDLGTFLVSNPNLDLNYCCLEVVYENVALPATNDIVVFELADSQTSSLVNPGMFCAFTRAAGPAFQLKAGNRQTTNAVLSTGVSQGGTLPSYCHQQVIGSGISWHVAADANSSVATPWNPTTYRGSCGIYSSKSPADVVSSNWGSATWVDLSITVNSSTAAQIRVKRVRFLRLSPAV